METCCVSFELARRAMIQFTYKPICAIEENAVTFSQIQITVRHSLYSLFGFVSRAPHSFTSVFVDIRIVILSLFNTDEFSERVCIVKTFVSEQYLLMYKMLSLNSYYNRHVDITNSSIVKHACSPVSLRRSSTEISYLMDFVLRVLKEHCVLFGTEVLN
jgi:hypothetical protein